jgi:chemotaxis signal transduction protein
VDGGSGAVSRLSRLLIVEVAGEPFAIDARVVREVVGRVPLTRSVRLPRSVLGLAALRGEPYPVLDLAVLVGREPVPLDESSCYVLTNPDAHNALLGFAANRIIGTERIDSEQLLPVPAVGDKRHVAAQLLGVAAVQAKMIPVLDLRGLLEAERVDLSGFAAPSDLVVRADLVEHRQRTQSRKVLVFDAGDTRVAVETAELSRVAPRPSPSRDGGAVVEPEIATIDGHDVVVLDAAKLLEAGPAKASDRRGVVVLGRANDNIAVAFDAVDTFAELEIAPGAVADDTGSTVRRGVVEMGQGVVELISLSALLGTTVEERDKLIAKNIVRRIGEGEQSELARRAAAELEAKTAQWREFEGPMLLVKIGSRAFALPGRAIVEVLPYGVLLPAPGHADGVIGLFELRGSVHAVLDVAERLDVERSSLGTSTDACIVIVSSATGPSGLFVDSVLEWRRVEAAQLGPTSGVSLCTYPDLFLAALTASNGEDIPLVAIDRLLADTRPPLREKLVAMGGQPAPRSP